MEITIVNPREREWKDHRFVLWFGACGATHLMVWADSLEEALDEAVDWIAENAPGLLCDDEVREAYEAQQWDGDQRLLPFLSEEEMQQEAEVDTTIAGNEGHYLRSWEWGITAEDPSRKEVLALLAA